MMSELINIYCDESCHLENDHQTTMVLGASWCPAAEARAIAEDIRELKERHGLSRSFEIKWTKVSPGGLPFYEALLAYFFSRPDLHFRALVARDKHRLRHDRFKQTHDTWYYKMYFQLLSVLLSPSLTYSIYLDIKDTRSAARMRSLHDILCNSIYDFDRTIISRVQTVRSHEIEQLQLADLLTGIVSYANRGLDSSQAKATLVERMQGLSGYDLRKTTLLREEKVNIFQWDPREASA